MKTIYSRTLLAFAALAVASTGCVGYVRGPRAQRVYVSPPIVEVAPAPVVIYEEDDYVYYPRYQMYYGSRSHHYFVHEGSAWVPRPAPPRVSVDVLFASPSVNVEFHDSPARHHEQVVQAYPKNWTPPGQSGQSHGRKKGQPDDSNEGKPDKRGGNPH